MKTIEIKSLSFDSSTPACEEISHQLDKLGHGHNIDIAPWPEYSYKPEVNFNIAYNVTDLYLKFYVMEESIRAVNSDINDNVWEDSCVELFIAPSSEDVYYNFEFNCIGTCLVQKGTTRNNRSYFDVEVIKSIKAFSSIGKDTFEEKKGDFSWELTIKIPLASFIDDIKDLKGSKMKANFYKCGDKLADPHFLTWNRIEIKEPDFHRPDFFGDIYFV